MIRVCRLVVPLLLALSGCVTTHNDMMRSANNLRSSTDAFVGDGGYQFPHAPLFADQAENFLETVRGAGDREVILAYDHLWDLYHVLRDEVEHSGSVEAEAGFKPVTHAFTYVVLDMRGYADADGVVYARGGFQHDPYYDP